MNNAASVTIFSCCFSLSVAEMLVTGFIAKIAPRENRYLVISIWYLVLSF
jgi:hypothetical protein